MDWSPSGQGCPVLGRPVPSIFSRISPVVSGRHPAGGSGFNPPWTSLQPCSMRLAWPSSREKASWDVGSTMFGSPSPVRRMTSTQAVRGSENGLIASREAFRGPQGASLSAFFAVFGHFHSRVRSWGTLHCVIQSEKHQRTRRGSNRPRRGFHEPHA